MLNARASPKAARCGKLGPMKSGVWNLGIGLVGIAAGATGEFRLPFTNSPAPLIVVGALIATLGVYQLWRARGK
jgi:hypothetical protein